MLAVTFVILDVLYGSPRPLSAREISEAIGMKYGTAFNYLTDLELGGFIEAVEQEETRGRRRLFCLGPRLVQLGADAARRRRPAAEARS